MPVERAGLLATCAAATLVLAQCGAPSNPPTTPSTPIVKPSATPLPTPTPTPTPASSGRSLPAGMTCDPTPPPILRMHLKVHAGTPGVDDRLVLDSKPLVVNVDNYCDRVGFGGWKFCDTRPEGHPERAACDYLVVGKSEDTQRWGPTWFYGNDLCSYFPDSCNNHASEQFLSIAKAKGTYEACADEFWPVATDGTRCGTIEIK